MKKTKDYYVMKTAEERMAVLGYLKENRGILAVDTETTGTNPHTCELMGISFCREPGEAFYIVVNTYEDGELKGLPETELFQLRAELIELLEHQDTQIVMHNATYDINVMRRTMGVDCLQRLKADTMLQKHTVDESKPHGLKDTVLKFLNILPSEMEDLKESVTKNGGKWNKTQKDMYMGDTDILGKYACADSDMTLQLFFKLDQELNNQGLADFYYKDEVHPLIAVVADDMVGRGVCCDLPYFLELKKNLTEEAEQLEAEAHQNLKDNYSKHYESLEASILEKAYPLKERGILFEKLYDQEGLPVVINKKSQKPTFTKKVLDMAFEDHPDSNLLKWRLGKLTEKEFLKKEAAAIYQARKDLFSEGKPYVINLCSNDQLKEILFNRLGEKPIKTTEKHNAQVDESVLEHFAKEYEFIAHLLKLRKINKLLSTYVEAVINKNVDGIVHPGWMQHGTDSGRFACKDPNFQNLPSDDDRIKHGIVARDGFVLVGCDYSQLEPRIFSHYSEEESLIEAYKRGDDFYGTVAVDVYDYAGNPNTMKDDGAKDVRDNCKTIALAIAYGAKKWRIGGLTGKTPDAAQKDIDKYWKTYSKLFRFVNRSHGEAIKNGWVKTEAGRVRRFDGIDRLRKSKKRADKLVYNKLLNLSINFKIQSTAASIVNRAMIALKKAFKEEGLEAYVVIQVHDEIVVEAREDQAEQVKATMKRIMENNYTLSVPLVADPKIAKRLSETK